MFSGAGRNLAIKRILVHFESKIYTFCCIKETRKPLFSEQNSEAEILMLCIELNYKNFLPLMGLKPPPLRMPACSNQPIWQISDLLCFPGTVKRIAWYQWKQKTTKVQNAAEYKLYYFVKSKDLFQWRGGKGQLLHLKCLPVRFFCQKINFLVKHHQQEGNFT